MKVMGESALTECFWTAFPGFLVAEAVTGSS